jgi:hypothetical protein
MHHWQKKYFPQFCDIEKLVNLVSPKLVEFALETQKKSTFVGLKKIIGHWFFVKKCNS